MKMEKMPEVKKTADGAFWKNTYEKFEARVYVPESTLKGDILNYGFIAPYLLIFADKAFSEEEQVSFARECGFEKLAAAFDSSVVFDTNSYTLTDTGKEFYRGLYIKHHQQLNKQYYHYQQ